MWADTVRLAVVGLGRIGRIHAANVAGRIKGARLVACADPSTDAIATTVAETGVNRAYTDFRYLLELDDVDAVVVATPTATHVEVVEAAAEARKRIFCEKPIDLDLGRIDALIAKVESSGVSMMVGFQRRFDPDFVRLREAVADGRVGEIHIVRITSRDGQRPHESFLPESGGIFLDMTVHDIDMVRFLTGLEVHRVYAQGSVLVDPMFGRYSDWDTAIVTLTLDGGTLATIDNSRRTVYGQDQRIEVFGSQGMAAVDNPHVDKVITADVDGHHAARLPSFFQDRYAHAYRLEMQAFVDAIRDGRPMPVTGVDGRRATAIASAARDSARENRCIAVPHESVAGDAITDTPG